MKKNHHTSWTVFFLIVILILYGVSLWIVIKKIEIAFSRVDLLVILSLMVFVFISAIIKSGYDARQKKEFILGSLEPYFEEFIAHSGVIIIVFESDGTIIWTSENMKNRFNKNMVGKKIQILSNEFAKQFWRKKTIFKFEVDNIWYEAHVNFKKNILLLTDVTKETEIKKRLEDEGVVIGEVVIDNYQHLQTFVPEESFLRAQASIIQIFEQMSEKYNLIQKQYSSDKFTLFLNKKALNKLLEDNFHFLDEIRKHKLKADVALTASVGFGKGTPKKNELLKLAREAVYLAQSRGGDQVVILSFDEKPYYHGSKIENTIRDSKVEIKRISETLEWWLKNKAIKKVLIYGHEYADLDAAGAAWGLARIALSYRKKPYIVNKTFDQTTKLAIKKFLTDEEKNFNITPERARRIVSKGETLILIVDTAELHRIEDSAIVSKVYPKNVFIFDHHRNKSFSKKIPHSNIYINTRASSTSEIVTEIMEFLDINNFKLSVSVANLLLSGIYLDTKGFQNSVTARTFATASFLEKSGASSSEVVKLFKYKNSEINIITEMLSNVQEVVKGYFLVATKKEIPVDLVSKIADEILRTESRKASFVIAKIPGKNEYKMSARGIDVNVQIIAEDVGGGGNFNSAAAETKETLEEFRNNVEQAIKRRYDSQKK